MIRQRGFSSLGGDDSPWRVSSIISFPGRLLVGAFSFLVHSWSSSRHWRPFLWGMPAMLFLMMAVAVATIPPWLLRIDKKRNDFYSGRYGHYLTTEGQAPHALTCAWRLVELNPDDLEFKYAVGQALQLSGDSEAAARSMRSLASLDAVGLPKAHVWLADYHLVRVSGKPDLLEEGKSLARQHLNFALQGDTESFTVEAANATMRLAQLFLSESRHADAQPLLEQLVARRWEFTVQLQAMPMLLACMKETSEPSRVDVVFERITSELAPLARRMPDSVEAWNTLISCCLRVDRFELAEEYLREGLALSREQRTKIRLLLMKAELHVYEANTYTDFNSEEQARARLLAAANAVMVNSAQRNAYEILHPYIHAYLVDADRERLLREAMLASETRPVIQVMIGFAESLRENSGEAEQMWRIAAQSFPAASNVLTSLVITSIDQPEANIEVLWKVLELGRKVFVDNASLELAVAELRLAEGDPAAAMAVIEPLRERFGDSLQLQVVYLKALEANGDTAKAEEVRAIIKQMMEQL